MLRWLIARKITAFERENDYDMGYAREMLAADPKAVWAFSKVQALSEYRKEVPRDAYFAAAIAGTMHADCGPCTQLMVTFALRAGVAPETVAAVVGERDEALDETAKLGAQFARASLTRSLEAEALRARIVELWGPRALVSLAFSLVSSQMYPTLKYALGHGAACSQVVVAGAPVARKAA